MEPWWIPLITGSGGALFVMAIGLRLFIKGKIHPDSEFQRVLDAYDKEVTAHERTREALALANTRADAGMKPAEIIAAVLSSQRGISP